MPQTKRLILGTMCIIAIAFSAVLLLQAAGGMRPLGVGFGDGTRGRAYSAEADGSIVLRAASGMTAPPPGKYAYRIDSQGTWDGIGIHYHRWNMTAGGSQSAPVIGSFAEVRIALGWPVLGSLVAVALWLMHSAKERRRARNSGCCPKCGYDLRATPDRCPECGQVPATSTAA